MSEFPNPNEPLPVSEVVKVIECVTIYKTTKWWCAVALVNMFGHNKVSVYQWKQDDKAKKGWKRKQKFTLNHSKDWEAIKKAIEMLLPKAGI